jgi:hypothetical protein
MTLYIIYYFQEVDIETINEFKHIQLGTLFYYGHTVTVRLNGGIIILWVILFQSYSFHPIDHTGICAMRKRSRYRNHLV